MSHHRWRRDRWTSAAVALLLMLTACTGDTGDGGSQAEGKPPQSTGDASLAAPTDVTAEIVRKGSHASMKVAFAAVEGADAHVVNFPGDDLPARIGPEFCENGRCEMNFGRMSTRGADTFTVSAVVGDATSKPSTQVEIPDWDEPARIDELPKDEPVQLVIVRVDQDGRPTYGTETVPVGEDVQARMAELRKLPGVKSVEIDLPLQPQSAPAVGGEPSTKPWHETAMTFDQIPGRPRGEGTTIAVLDTGVDTSHPSFHGAQVNQIKVANPNYTVDFHGTAVTSLVAGQASGEVPGIAPGAKINAYDVSTDIDTPGDYEKAIGNLATGITKAVDDGAEVISISMVAACVKIAGINVVCPDGILEPAVDYAEANGVVIVAGAGNDGDGAEHCNRDPDTGDQLEANQDNWPAKFATVIATGAHGEDGKQWECSARKPYVDALAPGDNMTVASPGDAYETVPGTSAAAPLVAGLISTALSTAGQDRDLYPSKIRETISISTTPNKRLITNAFLTNLGIAIPDMPNVDPVTATEIVPFATQVMFDESSPVFQAAERFTKKHNNIGVDAWNWNDDDSAIYRSFRIKGTLFVDKRGSITGVGQFADLTWYVSNQTSNDSTFDTSAHSLHCPTSVDKPTSLMNPPRALHRWPIPITFSGQVHQRRPRSTPPVNSDKHGRSADLNLSLGYGATPKQHGVLGKPQIVYNNFADCKKLFTPLKPTVIHMAPPDYDASKRVDWPTVKQWPKKHQEYTGAMYQATIVSSPFVYRDISFPAKAKRDRYPSAGTFPDSLVRYETQIGHFNETLFANEESGKRETAW